MSQDDFPSLVASLLRSRHRDRARLRAEVAAEIGVCPARLAELLDAATGEGGGSEGLDIATDVVSLLPGDAALGYAMGLWIDDARRLDEASRRAHADYDPRDDVWYALVRGIAANPGVDLRRKLHVAELLLSRGTESMREAAVHALGDIGGEGAEAKLRRLMNDSCSSVRGAARGVLGE